VVVVLVNHSEAENTSLAAFAVSWFEKKSANFELKARIGACAIIKSYNGGWLKRTFEGHTRRVNSVQVSPDGRYAISGSNDHTVKLWILDWDLETC
jgi:WD40 repeat protein